MHTLNPLRPYTPNTEPQKKNTTNEIGPNRLRIVQRPSKCPSMGSMGASRGLRFFANIRTCFHWRDSSLEPWVQGLGYVEGLTYCVRLEKT